MLLNILGGERTDENSGQLGQFKINRLHGLIPSHLLECLGGKVVTRVDCGSRVLNFIFVLLALVGLTSSNKLGYHTLDLRNLSTLLVHHLDFVWLLLQGNFFIRELQRDLDKGLLVLSAVGEAPTNVLIGSLLQVALNVMEGVLGDVGNTSVGVLPHFSDLRNNLSNEKLNHGRFTGSIFSDTGNAGTERNLHRNIEKRGSLVDRVSESTLAHLHEGLSLGSDSFDGSGLGELELHLGLAEREVGTGLWVGLNVFVQISLEGVELQVVERHDVRTAIVQKSGIVTDNDGSHVGERVQVGLDPGHIDDV